MAGNYLPGVLGFIADELGKDLAVAFAKAFGGREVYIPKVVRRDSVLAEKLGLEAAARVAKLLGAGDLVVPCGDLAGAAGRNARIAEMCKEGRSHSEIAQVLDLHIRTVQRVASRVRCERQECLRFDE